MLALVALLVLLMVGAPVCGFMWEVFFRRHFEFRARVRRLQEKLAAETTQGGFPGETHRPELAERYFAQQAAETVRQAEQYLRRMANGT
ncbi:hypothetical protein ACL02T_34470 [Pseudonocardia sp. RS010]|uniref:hypothetical protein n=1 Tax=Pseudonocardia sp. RS010 TaxID=3385979 RepID=UPI0039A30ACD